MLHDEIDNNFVIQQRSSITKMATSSSWSHTHKLSRISVFTPATCKTNPLRFTSHLCLFCSNCQNHFFRYLIVIHVVHCVNQNGSDRFTKLQSKYPLAMIPISLLKCNLFLCNRAANRTKDVRSLEPFTNGFRRICPEHDALSLINFCKLFEDSSVKFSTTWKTFY